MCEITNENFIEMFSIIKKDINHSSFIAIDTEMTGLVIDKTCTPSLFDTIDKRYAKQRQSVSKFIVTQFGLSLYSKDPKLNIYQSKTYSFYLCPRSLPNRKTSFAIDLSAIEFLAYNHFNFDKFAKNGINYLNETEEQYLRQNFEKCLEFDLIESPFNYDQTSHELSDWISDRLVNNNSGNQLVLKCKPTVNPLLNFAFLRELRNNFNDIWIQEINNKFIAKPIDLEQRLKLLANEEHERQEVIEKMVGFSAVFKCLIESKRPIVGHNMVMDLLQIYHHFYKPLPKTIKDFKSSLHSLFPFIFDTKCILFNERQNLVELSHIIKNRSLGDMYLKLTEDEIANSFGNSPKIDEIKDNNHFAIKDYSPHNAGFDAFATAFIFIKVAHILMVKNDRMTEEVGNNSWFEILKSVEKHCNKVNLIRANIHYLCISEADPKSVRPKWLFARKRDKNSHFSVTKLTTVLSATGTADIKLMDNNSLLIAVSSHGM